MDNRMAAGEDVGPLCGLAIVAKDLFDVTGYTTAAGTPALMGAGEAPSDAIPCSAGAQSCYQRVSGSRQDTS